MTGFTRKVDHAGRINLPSELCTTFGISKDDVVSITNNEEYILIKKYRPDFVCVITGKITDKGKMIGNSFISDEGLKIIQKELKKKK